MRRTRNDFERGSFDERRGEQRRLGNRSYLVIDENGVRVSDLWVVFQFELIVLYLSLRYFETKSPFRIEHQNLNFPHLSEAPSSKDNLFLTERCVA